MIDGRATSTNSTGHLQAPLWLWRWGAASSATTAHSHSALPWWVAASTSSDGGRTQRHAHARVHCSSLYVYGMSLIRWRNSRSRSLKRCALLGFPLVPRWFQQAAADLRGAVIDYGAFLAKEQLGPAERAPCRAASWDCPPPSHANGQAAEGDRLPGTRHPNMPTYITLTTTSTTSTTSITGTGTSTVTTTATTATITRVNPSNSNELELIFFFVNSS